MTRRGVAARRQAHDRASCPSPCSGCRPPPAPRAPRGRGPRCAGWSACCSGHRASTGRSMPSVRTTRWHGTISGTGLWPSAVPTARTARGRPISAATQPYGRTSPRGISSALRQTSCSNGLWPRRSRSIRTRRSPPSRRAMASARRGGSASARKASRPVAARWRVSNVRVVVGRVDERHAAAVPGHDQRPDRRVDAGVGVGQADLDQHGGAERRRAPARPGRPAPPRRPSVAGRADRASGSCGHLLELVAGLRLEHRS